MILLTYQFGVPSIPIWIFAWIFMITGIIVLLSLLLYAKYGRELSLKFSIITILIASALLGFAIHFFLLNFGF